MDNNKKKRGKFPSDLNIKIFRTIREAFLHFIFNCSIFQFCFQKYTTTNNENNGIKTKKKKYTHITMFNVRNQT